MAAKTKKPDEIVKLVLVVVDGASKVSYKVREREYIQRDKMFIAIETDDIEAPMGLKRVLRSEMPKLGGILNTIALATDVESGRQKLMELWQTKEKRLNKEMEEVQHNLLLLRLNQK